MHSALTALNLSFSDISDQGAAALAEGLSFAKLVTLDLAGNAIGDAGAQSLASVVKSHPTLASLDLHRNRIGPLGAQAMGVALIANAALTSLDLTCNPIPEDGGSQHIKAMKAGLSVHVNLSKYAGPGGPLPALRYDSLIGSQAVSPWRRV